VILRGRRDAERAARAGTVSACCTEAAATARHLAFTHILLGIATLETELCQSGEATRFLASELLRHGQFYHS
jgi:hypothetical protein